MDVGDEDPQATQVTGQQVPVEVRRAPSASSPLPWLLFIIATLVLGGLAGYFARRVSQESTRADIAVADRMSTTARAKEQDRAMESLQDRVKSLSDELKKAQDERDALATKVKTLSEKPAAVEKPAAAKKAPPKKKKRR